MADRDLSFKPVTHKPRTLTAEQVEYYNKNGYLSPLDVFGEEKANENRAYFDMLLKELQEANDGRDSYSINGYQTRCRGLYDLILTPRILDVIEDIVGPNIICWGTHYFCKLPLDPKSVPWHQDASYWPFTPARTVTVWLAIDDADVDNSCMHVIPGTHAMGHLKWKQTEQNAVLGQEVVDVERLGKPAPIELKAGQMEIHADMLAHGSFPNLSNRRRCGLTMRFCPPEVQAITAEWAYNAMLCRGEDHTGHWRHMPRPAGEDVKGERPKQIGGN
jgi:hypothetical protein